MKIGQENIFVGNNRNRSAQAAGAGFDPQGEDKAGKAVDGRDFVAALDPIAMKKARAQKQAMKLVGDAFQADISVDRDLEARREKIRQLQQESGEDRKSIRDIEANREEFRKANGIAADSQEQKDLELLAKEKEAGFYGSEVRLTDEEQKELNRIRENGLTRYQEESLSMKEDERYYAERIGKAKQEIRTENAVITGTKLEMLKHHAMADAQQEAEQIRKQASKDIVSMLVSEGKENMEEEQEEKRAQAKEEAEKREELQAKVDDARKRRKEQEKLTEDILEKTQGQRVNGSGVTAAQQEVKDILQKMQLVEEDVKGAMVDQGL